METSSKISDIRLTESNYTFLINPSDYEPDEFVPKDVNLEEPHLDEFLLPGPMPTENHSFQLKPDDDCITMFVGQIPHNYTESDLLIMFERFGKVYNISLLYDKITGRSKGCCFVTFFTRQAALSAQYALHNIEVLPGMHHPIQMKPADNENRNDRKLFVGMLPRRFSEGDVRTFFSPYGAIEECIILRYPNRQSKGCAFVTYTTRQSAWNAVQSMHQSHTFQGCPSPIVVKFADTQKDKERRRLSQIQNKLCELNPISSYLKQLSLDAITTLVATNTLVQHLQKSGYINMNFDGGVYFPNQLNMLPSQATRPSANLNEEFINHLLNGNNGVNDKMLLNSILAQLNSGTDSELIKQSIIENIFQNLKFSEVQEMNNQLSNPVKKQIEGPDGANLFIYHIPQEFTDLNLADLFRPYGKIISAKLFIDKVTKMPKSFGFVSYDNAESAQIAIQSLNGYQILGKKLKVELKKNKETSRR